MKRTLLFGHFCSLVLHLNIYNHHGTPFIMEIWHNCIHVSTQPTHISFHTNYKPYIFIPFIAWLEDWVFQFIICQNKIATKNEQEKMNTLLFCEFTFDFNVNQTHFIGTKISNCFTYYTWSGIYGIIPLVWHGNILLVLVYISFKWVKIAK